ncbi:MAG TPA: carbohydrate binding domain-containing protein, partial [Candidatus Binatia bacterium]|nr:carbohydrate binding domain-containing protein [Candidatus Binatia bacterium]
LRYFQVVLGNDPEAVASVLELCWRASGDATQIMDHALPPRSDLYLSFLSLLVTKQQVAAAESVWNRLIALQQPFSATPALPYFRLLIAQHEVDAAKSAWQQLAKLDPSLEPYLPSQRNLVVNGGFEENLLNGGFDWWFQSYSHAELNIDTNEFRTGTRSLSVTFDGQSVPGPQLVQFIPVKPNTSYEFSAESRTQDIDTASGPRFAITDAYTNQSYVLTDDTLGSTPWRIQEARFQTGPNTKLLMLKIVRDPPQPLIRGKMWIDDVTLTEVMN